MGFRLSKSFKVAPGVRVRVSTKSVGLSAGTRGAHLSVNSRTGTRATASLPGTGLSYSKQLSGGARRTVRRAAPVRMTPRMPALPSLARSTPSTPPSTTPPVPKPGLLSRGWERKLYAALTEGRFDDLEAIGRSSAEARPVCLLFGTFFSESPERARAAAQELWDTQYHPETEQFVARYLPTATCTVELTDELCADLPVSRDALGLFLAELLQSDGEVEAAIDVVESVEPSTYAAVSLADLYADGERWQDVVDLTDGVTNDDEFATFLLIQRGAALRELGHPDAARESLKAALAPRQRPRELRHRALVERAATYLAEGKRARARADLARVMAENSAYPGLRDLIDRLGS